MSTEKFTQKGLVLILQTRKLIPSGGNMAYFLAQDGKLYELQRESVFPLNDSYFYPFSGKECELRGEIFQEGKIYVRELTLIGEGYLMGKNEHLLPKTFESIPGIPVLHHSDKLEISLVRNIPGMADTKPRRLYLKVKAPAQLTLFVRLSVQALSLFLDRRISLLELISLRQDELLFQELGEAGEAIATEAIFFSKLKKQPEELSWHKVYFGDELSSEQILSPLKKLTEDGIFGVYQLI
jgi:hypothetical protein